MTLKLLLLTTYEIKMKIWLTMVSTIAKLIQTRSTTYAIKMKLKLLWLTMVSNIAMLVQLMKLKWN